jgi:hypothetical protein
MSNPCVSMDCLPKPAQLREPCKFPKPGWSTHSGVKPPTSLADTSSNAGHQTGGTPILRLEVGHEVPGNCLS